MADTLSTQDLAELKQLYKDLQNIQIPDMNDFIKGLGGIEAARKNLVQMRKEFANINSDVSYFAESLTRVLQELKGQNSALNKTKSAYSSLSSIASKLKYDQDGISRLSEKELIKISEKTKQNRASLDLAKQINEERLKEINSQLQSISYNPSKIAALQKERKALQDANNETIEFLKDQENGYIALEGAINKRIKKEEELKDSIGVTGNALKLLNKIPGLSGALDTEQALEDMREFAEELQAKGEDINSFNNKLKIAGKGLQTAIEGLKKSLTDPVTIITAIVDSLLKGSDAMASFRKEIGMSYSESYKLNTELNAVAAATNDTFITGEKLKKSFTDLSKEMGFVADYGSDALVSMTNLTEKLGMSGKEAAQLTTLSRMQSKNTEAVLDDVGRTVTAMNKQGKTSILLKDVMKDIANVSKATAVSLGSNPKKIAEAAVAAKQLGTTLEQLESTADSLLNFESSIENELKAELLTGKQMNLERARAAALANDMKTLSEEIGKNEEVISAFASGNRLAQQATAEALGMSREQLASMVYQQEAMKIGAEGVRAKYGEQAYEQLKAQSAQEKFANAVEKLKSVLSSIVQIFTPIIDAIAFLVDNTFVLYGLMGVIALSYLPKIANSFTNIGKGIAGAASNFTKLFSKEGRASLFGGGGAAGGADKAKETADKAAGAGGKADAGGPKAGEGIKNTLKGISSGISSFSKVKVSDIFKVAGAALALVALTPAVPALLALQFVNGKTIRLALAGIGQGLAAMGKALKDPRVMLGLGVATLAIMGLGKALQYAAPAVEAFGNVIKSVFEGIGTIITAAANGIVTIFGSLQSIDVTKLLAIGPALIGIGVGLASLGAGGVIGAIGTFLSGDPIEKLKGLAASGDGLTKTATALQAIAGALIGVSAALVSIDTSKLEALDNFSNSQSSNSAVSGITNFITAPIKVIGEAIGGGDKEEIKAGVDLTPMIAAINEVKAAVDRLYNKDTSINMDGKKVGSTLVQGSYKVA